MKIRFLGCEMILLAILLALLWVEVAQGQQELIRVVTELGKLLAGISLFVLTIAGIMFIIEGGIPED